MEQEIWKEVVGHEGSYEVSNFGRIKSKLGVANKNRILKAAVCKGYFCVVLCLCGTKKMKKVHRLVCEAFIPNPENKPTVNHKDGDRKNNNLKNLEWATHKEQVDHYWKAGLNPNFSKKRKRVAKLDGGGNIIESFSSLKAAKMSMSDNASTGWIISRSIKLNTMAYGYKWKLI